MLADCLVLRVRYMYLRLPLCRHSLLQQAMTFDIILKCFSVMRCACTDL